MSVVTNMTLITKEISIKNNNLPDGEFVMNTQFKRDIGATVDGKYFTELSITIANTEENPFPIDLHVCLAGIFDLEGKDPEYIDTFLKINAVQIIFPYLRTMVSNITSSAMMPPIVLPIINPQTLFANS